MKAFFKNMEQALRAVLLSALRLLARTRSSVPPSFDFNTSKVLFIRQDRIGDVLVSTPLFASLKKHFPQMFVDVLLSKNNHFVVEQNPNIRKRWVYTKRFLSSLRIIRGIRAEHYDFVIDLMDNPSATSTVVLLLSGGRWTVGLDKENAYACDIVVPLKSRKESHIVDRLAQLLTVFGIDPDREHLALEYVVAREAQEEARRVLHSMGEIVRPLIGVNISAGSETRFWGVDNYRALAAFLCAHFPAFSVVILSKPGDKNRAMNIADGFQGVFVPPETSFDGFAAWIQRLSMLITPDTSAVHLAAAFHIPCVVLYVQSNPDLRIWEPYGTPGEVLVTRRDDLRTISVDQVMEAVNRLAGRPDVNFSGRVSESL